ncbi:MAG: DNA repair protein RecO [Candidatus Pacebacteria bacterium]|nr:DNA repair protein RecO [Candidatus Paceibacterota bacterium]
MDKNTKIIEAIILKTEPAKENDVKVLVYSREEGKLFLSMKGALRASSKLIGHVQPLSFSTLMIISGKQGDYIGSAKNIETYLNIRDNFKRLQLAGLSARLFSCLLKTNQSDQAMFFLIKSWLDFLNTDELSLDDINFKLYSLAFNLKFISLLGLFPDITLCSYCRKPLSNCQELYYFSKEQGAFSCSKNHNSQDAKLSLNSLKLMKFLALEDFQDINRLLVSKEDVISLSEAVRDYMIYEFKDSLKDELVSFF